MNETKVDGDTGAPLVTWSLKWPMSALSDGVAAGAPVVTSLPDRPAEPSSPPLELVESRSF